MSAIATSQKDGVGNRAKVSHAFQHDCFASIGPLVLDRLPSEWNASIGQL